MVLLLFSMVFVHQSYGDIVITNNGPTQSEQVSSPSFSFEKGSPEACPQKATNRLQALPGYGWDSLQNEEMATIFEPRYTKCRVTNDRKFLIPDGLEVHPKKKSDVQIYSTLIEHISDYKSATASSVEVNFGFSFIVNVHASFSKEYKTTKEHMVKSQSSTTRTECRYVVYTIQNEPDSPLSGPLKKRFYDLASAIQSNEPELVRYLADLLVRDYGTHVITTVDVGAALMKEDQVNNQYVKHHGKQKSKITASASASFLSIVNMGMSYSKQTSKEQLESYEANCTNSRVQIYGGSLVGSNLSLSDWLSDIENNLASVDRSGDPLWFLVSPTYLPELPVDTVGTLAHVVQEAVISYYQHNTYPGCMDIDSPNYSYMANKGDDSCEGPATNYTFGGIFQSCHGVKCNLTYTQKNL